IGIGQELSGGTERRHGAMLAHLASKSATTLLQPRAILVEPAYGVAVASVACRSMVPGRRYPQGMPKRKALVTRYASTRMPTTKKLVAPYTAVPAASNARASPVFRNPAD